MALVDPEEPPLCGALILRGRAERRACSAHSDVFGRCSTPDLHAQSTSDGLATARDRFTSAIAGESSYSSLVPPTDAGLSHEALNVGAGDDRLRRTCAWYQTRAESAEAELQALREGIKQLRSSTADLQLQVQLAEAKAVERETHAEAAEGRAWHFKMRLDDARSERSRLEARVEAAHAEAAAQKLWTEAAKAEAATQFLRAATAEEETLAYRSWVEAAKVMQASVAQANVEGERLLQASQGRRGTASSPQPRMPPGHNASRITEPEAETVGGQSPAVFHSARVADLEVQLARRERALMDEVGEARSATARISRLSSELGEQARAAEFAKAQSERSSGLVLQLEAQLAQAEHAAQRTSELEAQLAAAQPRHSDDAAPQLEARLSEAEVRAARRGEDLEAALKRAEAAEASSSDLAAELGSMRAAITEASARTGRAQAELQESRKEGEAAASQREAALARAAELGAEAGRLRSQQEGVARERAEAEAARSCAERRVAELEERLKEGATRERAEAEAARGCAERRVAELEEKLKEGAAKATAEAEAARACAERRVAELEGKLQAMLAKEAQSVGTKQELEVAKKDMELLAEKQAATWKVALGKAQAEREQFRQALDSKTRELQSQLEQQRGTAHAKICELQEQLEEQRAAGERAVASAREEGEKLLRACEVRNRELGRQLAAVQDALTAETKATIKMSELATELAQQRREVELQLAGEAKGHTLRPSDGRHAARARDLEGKCSARSLQLKRHSVAASMPSLPAAPGGPSRRQERPGSAGGEALAATARRSRPQSAGPHALEERPSSAGGEALAATARHSRPRSAGPHAPEASQQQQAPVDGVRATSPPKSLSCSRSFSAGSLHQPTLHGLSVHHFKSILLDEVYTAGLHRGATLYEVETGVLRSLGANSRCTKDGRLGASYVDLLRGEDACGPATHFLSCSRGAAVGDVADALDRYCREAGLSPKRTYVWHNSLCVNPRQRRSMRCGHGRGRSGCAACGIEREDAIVDDLTCRIRSIGKVLAVASPWDKPQQLSNAGCIAEMFLALSLGSAEVSVLAPPVEGERLAADLLDGGPGLTPAWQALSSVRIEECKASDSPETEAILRFVDDGPGAAHVDASVARRLQTWLAEEAERHTRRLLASGDLDGYVAARVCDTVGWMLREVSLPDRATAMLQDGLQLALRAGALGSDVPPRSTLLSSIGAVGLLSGGGPDAGALRASEDAARLDHERMGTLETPAGLALLSSIGSTKWLAGDSAGALEALLEAKRVRHDMGSLESLDGAVLLRNIGTVRWASGDHDGGLQAYAEARALYEKTGSLATCGGVGLLLNIGFAKADRDDVEGSLEAYEEARRIFEAHGTLEMPSGATLLSSIGVAKGSMGDQAGALAAYQQARCVRERTGTSGSLAGAILLRNLGVAHAASGDRDAALEAYDEAWQLRAELGAQETPAGAGLLFNMGQVKAEQGDHKGQLEACREAKRIYECTGSLRSKGGQALSQRLGELEAAEESSPCWV